MAYPWQKRQMTTRHQQLLQMCKCNQINKLNTRASWAGWCRVATNKSRFATSFFGNSGGNSNCRNSSRPWFNHNQQSRFDIYFNLGESTCLRWIKSYFTMCSQLAHVFPQYSRRWKMEGQHGGTVLPSRTLSTLRYQWERLTSDMSQEASWRYMLEKTLASMLFSYVFFNHQIFPNLAAKWLSANNWHFSPSTFCRGCLQAVGRCTGAHLVRFWLSIDYSNTVAFQNAATPNTIMWGIKIIESWWIINNMNTSSNTASRAGLQDKVGALCCFSRASFTCHNNLRGFSLIERSSLPVSCADEVPLGATPKLPKRKHAPLVMWPCDTSHLTRLKGRWYNDDTAFDHLHMHIQLWSMHINTLRSTIPCITETWNSLHFRYTSRVTMWV